MGTTGVNGKLSTTAISGRHPRWPRADQACAQTPWPVLRRASIPDATADVGKKKTQMTPRHGAFYSSSSIPGQTGARLGSAAQDRAFAEHGVTLARYSALECIMNATSNRSLEI